MAQCPVQKTILSLEGILPTKYWGLDNVQIDKDVLRVVYQQGSASPNAHKTEGAPLGGVQFLYPLNKTATTACLVYDVRFQHHMDFVKGGKLPGLYGGTANTGGHIPNGTDGFSVRLMWRRSGAGEVYAYVPSSSQYGTSIGQGTWHFKTGIWYHIELWVHLNTVGRNDGHVRLFINNKEVVYAPNILFRHTDTLMIDGVLFSTFFGGHDITWATPKTVYADFKNIGIGGL
jgi:hypothetical protein